MRSRVVHRFLTLTTVTSAVRFTRPAARGAEGAQEPVTCPSGRQTGAWARERSPATTPARDVGSQPGGPTMSHQSGCEGSRPPTSRRLTHSSPHTDEPATVGDVPRSGHWTAMSQFSPSAYGCHWWDEGQVPQEQSAGLQVWRCDPARGRHEHRNAEPFIHELSKAQGKPVTSSATVGAPSIVQPAAVVAGAPGLDGSRPQRRHPGSRGLRMASEWVPAPPALPTGPAGPHSGASGRKPGVSAWPGTGW